MQNDFITGSLGTKEARAIVPKVAEKITEFIEERKTYGYDYHKLIFTQDTHHSDYMNTLEGKYLPIAHCIENTPGWCIHDDIFPFEEARVRKSGFGYPSWDKVINVGDGDTIEICGLCTDICVVTNAILLKTAFPKTKIIVDASCCAGTTIKKHKAALEVMRSCQIEVVNDD